MALSITIPADQVETLEKALGQQSTKQAMFQAVKRTISAGRTAIAEEIQKDTLIASKYVGRALTTKVVNETGGGVPEGLLRISRKSIPLIAFAVASDISRKGVLIQMTRNREGLTLRHAFIAKVGGHTGVFTRKRILQGSTKRARLPIEEMRGLSVIEAVGPEHLTVTGDRIMMDIRQILMNNLQSQVDRFLNQKKGQGWQLFDRGDANG